MTYSDDNLGKVPSTPKPLSTKTQMQMPYEQKSFLHFSMIELGVP